MSNSDQEYPYGQQYGQQPYADGSHGDHRAPYDAYDPYAQQPQPQQPDQGATQTWQGQTWDTQYQPAVEPSLGRAGQQPQPQPYQQPQPQQYQYQQPQQPQPQQPQPGYPAAADTDTAYLRPQTASASAPSSASGAYPLPPEVPVTHVAASTPRPAAARAAAPDTAGYSTPTTVGNSRVTDAQRARAEGRSPVIAPGMQPAAITAGLGLLLALGAAIGPYALLVPLVLLQAVTAAGWFRLNGMWPARQGIALAFAGGFVADAVLLAAGREHAAAAILGTLGVWVLLTLVLQLRSHAGADERMQGLMATVASASLTVLAAGHLAAVPDAVTVGGAAVAAAVVVRALPLPGAASVVVALLAAAGAGLAVGAFTDFGARSAFLGLAAGGCALIGLRVASYDYPSKFVHMTAGVALPLTVAAPAVYLIGRAIA